MLRELLQKSSLSSLQLFGGRCAQLLHRVQNSAALAGNLFITRPANFQFILFGPAGGMNQVGVRVHESWQHHPAADIHLFCFFALFEFFDLPGRTNRHNHALANQNRSVANYSNFRQRFPAPRPAPTHRNNLRSSAYEKGIAHRAVLCPIAIQFAQSRLAISFHNFRIIGSSFRFSINKLRHSERSEESLFDVRSKERSVRNYAPAALALYAGKNTSCAHTSIAVGVVFFCARCSNGFSSPSFAAAFISLMSEAVFPGIPLSFIPCSTKTAGKCLSDNFGFPIAAPIAAAASLCEMSRCPCNSRKFTPEKSRLTIASAAHAPISRVAIIGICRSPSIPPAKNPIDCTSGSSSRKFSMNGPGRRNRAFRLGTCFSFSSNVCNAWMGPVLFGCCAPMLLSSTTCEIPACRTVSVIAVLILSPDASNSGSFARGGNSTYAAVAPANAFSIAATSSASAVTTSAPNLPSGANLFPSRPTARTFSPLSSSLFATTDPVFPVAPTTTYISSHHFSSSSFSAKSLRPSRLPAAGRSLRYLFSDLFSLTPASALSHAPSSQTQSPPDNPHPRVESRPFPGHSSTPAHSAPPSLSFHPPRSPDPNVANSRSPLRRRCESTPTKRR